MISLLYFLPYLPPQQSLYIYHLTPFQNQIYCKNYDEVETERQACVVTTKPADIEYRLIIKTKSGDEYTIDDIGENESFTLPAGYGEVDIIWYGATPATSENIVDCYF